jgi:hypothetical protein
VNDFEQGQEQGTQVGRVGLQMAFGIAHAYAFGALEYALTSAPSVEWAQGYALGLRETVLS